MVSVIVEIRLFDVIDNNIGNEQMSSSFQLMHFSHTHRLRALSGGGGSNIVASPPLSPALPKYKLADYRYGREEMLALYVKDNKVCTSPWMAL